MQHHIEKRLHSPKPLMEVIVAPTYEWFVNWCSVDCDPPQNPRDRKFVLVTGTESMRRLRGRRARPEDCVRWIAYPHELMDHGRWAAQSLDYLNRELRMMGFEDWQHLT